MAGIFCAKHARVVGNDNCVHMERLTLQIPQQSRRRASVRAIAHVRRYTGGRLAIFHSPGRLADYHAGGRFIGEESVTK